MITIRPANARGQANFGWLDSQHSFSFGQYYDPNYMGFSVLRVINEDKVAPQKGFNTHGHKDMEIISYVLEGSLEHQDSIGNGSVIRPGDVQRMSAGTGIRHSEYNASEQDPVHFLQIWIEPDTLALEPSYEQIYFSPEDRQGQLRLIGSRDGRDGSITIHQDLNLYASTLTQSDVVDVQLLPNRVAWIQVANGQVDLNGQLLSAGDGASAIEEIELKLSGVSTDAEVLIFDLPNRQ